MSQARTGFVAAVAAFLLWGLFPLYWPLLEPAKPVEILSHRIVWSVVVLAVLLAATSGFRWAGSIGRPRAGLLVKKRFGLDGASRARAPATRRCRPAAASPPRSR